MYLIFHLNLQLHDEDTPSHSQDQKDTADEDKPLFIYTHPITKRQREVMDGIEDSCEVTMSF